MVFRRRDDIIVPTPNGQGRFDFTLFGPEEISAVAIVLTFLAVALVSLRCYSRHVTKAGLKGDDWAILAATVFAIALCALCVIDAVVGAHPTDIDYIFTVVVPANSLAFACVITAVYASILTLIKLSVILLYKRIFVQRWLQVLSNVLIAVTIAFWLFFIASVTIFSVKLYQAFHGGTSRASWATTQAALVLDLVLDAAILFVPVPIVARLNMSFGHKIQVLGLFAVASLWMIASAIRLVYLSQSVYQNHVGKDDRFVTALQTSYFFTIAATCLGICHACLPTQRPLIDRVMQKSPRLQAFFRRFFPTRLTSRGRSYGQDSRLGYGTDVAAPQTSRMTAKVSVQKAQNNTHGDMEILMVPMTGSSVNHMKPLPDAPQTPAEPKSPGGPMMHGRDLV